MSSSYSQGQMIALGVIFLILPTAFVGLRVWAKTLGGAGVSWDDYLLFMSLGFTIGSCVSQLVAAIHGQLGQHQTVAADGMPILDDPRFLLYERCKFALQMLAYLGLGFAKASILVLYMRIFAHRLFRICAQAMLGVVAAWTIVFFLTSLLQCLPVTPLVEPFYGNKCVNTIPLWYAGSISDIIIDFMILAMPMPMVWRLQLPMKQKIGVLAMFLLGATTCAASITRAVIFFQVGEALAEHFNDQTCTLQRQMTGLVLTATDYTSPVFFWTVIEMALSVISACLPTLRPIYLRFNPTQSAHSAKRSTPYNSGGSRYGRDQYRYFDSESGEFGVSLTERDSGVQTHIGAGKDLSSERPTDRSILVSKQFSSTYRPAGGV